MITVEEVVGESQRRELRKLNADLGPVVLAALVDPLTVEVVLNADGKLWQERLGEPMREIGTMPASQAEAVLRTVAAILKVTVTRESPILEGELPDGSRFAGQLPPVVEAPIFCIRKHASAVFSLEQYVSDGIMSEAQAQVLRDAVRDHRNILVSGATLSGKTTLLNAVIAEVVAQYPHQRLLILEDRREIQCAAPNVSRHRSNRLVSMTALVKATLSLRPDRIFLGEVRGPEALDLLDLFNTGHPGGACSLHANDERAAISRLLMLVSRHPESPKPIEPLIAEVQPLVIHLSRTPTGRKVRGIIEVTGYGPNGFQVSQL